MAPREKAWPWRKSRVRMMSRQLVFIGAGMFTVSMAWMSATESTILSAIRTSPEARATYLAHAIIWRDPGALSPKDVLEGPVGAFPYTYEQANSDEGIECTFAQAGKELGGSSAKFLCRTADGHDLRLKYWDPQSRTGNREVFGTVAASRLMWALGFDAVPALPIKVRCDGCPENPHTGAGSRRTRRYVAMLQAQWPTPVILSNGRVDQGWSWRDLDTAIRLLPRGLERARQRTYFNALTLLGVFMQHGDRKREQQRLYCAAHVDTEAGELRADNVVTPPLILLERPGASACPTSAVTIVDVGATFGGAGRESSEATAKMNLEAWERKRVFTATNGNECRGELTVSFRALLDGESNPVISEEGRRFLVEQLHRVTQEEVRAIFRAAHVDQLGPRGPDGSPEAGRAIDTWVAVFQDKVRQIEARRCQPAE
ncbi:MAG: hypothetical protein DMF84_06580 [Acidobacteria bacterium]|nr:MAG: hypothetical protein DMF84_06580 [Acidobacteriota bacterium]